ncbi:NUDIX domain-containing protein [Micromonospora globbae]|nr:NUDIX domain-containing protein [Micromonospora globbae]
MLAGLRLRLSSGDEGPLLADRHGDLIRLRYRDDQVARPHSDGGRDDVTVALRQMIVAALLRNERDEWELPGGKLEVGETPEDGVCREVAEELVLTVTEVNIIDSSVYEITAVRHLFIVSYGATYLGDEQLVSSAEHKELGAFAYDEVPGLHMPEPYKRTIGRWCRRIAISNGVG